MFTKADLSSGYWHVQLDRESSMLTTVQTCYGRYRFVRLPFGTSVSSEMFQKKLLEALDGLPGVVCIAGDVIEKEMLAVRFGLEKFHHYTCRRHVSVDTDHKPVVAIVRKPLSTAPKCLQVLLLRTRVQHIRVEKQFQSQMLAQLYQTHRDRNKCL